VVLARIQTQMCLKRTVDQVHRLERHLAERNQELEAVNVRLEEINRRMTRDLEAAARVQGALLPDSTPSIDGATFAWSFRPCDELAGDGFGVVRLDETRVGMYVLDVSGHGVASALLSVSVLRVLTPANDPASILFGTDDEDGQCRPNSPREVMGWLNRLFPFDMTTEQYFTIIYGILDVATGEFRYVSAGHPGPVYMPAAGAPRLLEGRGFPIGLAEGHPYDEHSVALAPGDRVFFYSDGVPEAVGTDGAFFGAGRFLEVIERASSVSLSDGVTTLRGDVEQWCGDVGVRDDVTILAAELGAGPSQTDSD
jgi:sigma-B regulation protein RsbU (phosphoserine phosphatase)